MAAVYLSMQTWWWSAEVQTEHQSGEERWLKWLWMCHVCWCHTEYFPHSHGLPRMGWKTRSITWVAELWEMLCWCQRTEKNDQPNNRTLRLTLTKAGQQKIKQRFPGLSLCFGIKVAASEFGLSSMKGSCFGCGVTVTAILFDTYQKALKTTAYPKTAADRPFVTTV